MNSYERFWLQECHAGCTAVYLILSLRTHYANVSSHTPAIAKPYNELN